MIELIKVEMTKGCRFQNAYWIKDERIQLHTLVNVYVREFTTEDKVPHWIPMGDWSQIQDTHIPIPIVQRQLFDGRLRLADPKDYLKGKMVAVAVLTGRSSPC